MGTAIAQARHTIWLATYIFHDDATSLALADALLAADRRGVRVRVVIDGFGSNASLATLRHRSAGKRVAVLTMSGGTCASTLPTSRSSQAMAAS